MEKLRDKISDWLPLGVGEVRRNLISGILATAMVVIFQTGIEGFFPQIQNIIELTKNNHMLLIVLILALILLGRVMDFFAGRFVQSIFESLRYPDFPRRDLYSACFWRLLRRRKLLELLRLRSYVKIRSKRINRLDIYKYAGNFAKNFAEDLTIGASEEYSKLPEIVQKGLINPLGKNWELCINYLRESSVDYEKHFILAKENNRKFIFMIIYSIYGGIILALTLHFFDIVDGIAQGLQNIKSNEDKKPKSIVDFVKVVSFFTIWLYLVPFIVFSYYKKYINYCCISYLENRALRKHLQRSASEMPPNQDSESMMAETDHSMEPIALQRRITS